MTLLCEEYVKRHKISVPFARHVQCGSLFLEDHNDSLVILFHWKQASIFRPGNYLVRVGKPVHNGCERGFCYITSKLIPQSVCYWDEFEDFLAGWSRSVDLVFGRQRVALKAWQIFLYCFDRRVANNIGPDALYDSIDLDLSVRERYKSMQETLRKLKANHDYLYQAWKNHMEGHLESYLHWVKDF